MTTDHASRPDLSIFDARIDRRGTECEKWDQLQQLYGLDSQTALPMWVADTEFRPPQVVQDALADMLNVGIYGYYGNDKSLRDAFAWWMRTRHGWDVSSDAVIATHGLVNGTAHIIDAVTNPGDGVVLMTPVYHAFSAIIRAAKRTVVECPLALRDNRYEMDFDNWDALIQPNTKLLILCSPHNPGGRVWTAEELRGVAAFCERHDLILASDEIHHDLVYPGHKHIPMSVAAPEIENRLLLMASASKTFNIAGAKVGAVIVTDPDLRTRFHDRLKAFGMSRNIFGMHMTRAAYSPEGAAWVDAQMDYLDGNRQLFDAGVNAIPGVRSMPLESTFLSWVDFESTGMEMQEVRRRINDEARIAVNRGVAFGKGGENFMRFNIGAPRSMIAEAVDRLQSAFRDLQ